MGSGGPSAQQGGRGGLYRHHLYLRLPGLEVLSCAGDGASGSHSGYEHIHLYLGVRPDFRAGAPSMGGGVGGVDELSGNDAVGNGPGQRLGLVNGPLHPQRPRRQHQLRAVG